MKNNLQSAQKGYTLIEMLVVITIVGIILPVVLTILTIIIQQQLKIYRLIEVKKQGDFTLSFIKNKIETEAVKISTDGTIVGEICTNTQSFQPAVPLLYFLNKNNEAFSFNTSNGELRVAGVSGINTSLTTNKVIIRNLSFSCYKAGNLGTPLVQVSYTIEYKNASANAKPEETALLDYKTKIRLSSF